MSDATPLDASLERLDAALARLERAAKNRGGAAEAALERKSAEAELVTLRHNRLIRETEGALADLDTLIASAERA
ncbi:MAG: hypothetical protein V2J26_13070 [Pacificimonas sp.]|jgi:hypothetical protein|nr:hypothetical protein [Pacificimonas sp.]